MLNQSEEIAGRANVADIRKQATAIETNPLLRCFTQDLWAAECCIGTDGVCVFHVETLEEALQTNALQIMRGWSAGYVPFALCETSEAAHEACDAMQKLQGLFREAQRKQAARQRDFPADAGETQDAETLGQMLGGSNAGSHGN